MNNRSEEAVNVPCMGREEGQEGSVQTSMRGVWTSLPQLKSSEARERSEAAGERKERKQLVTQQIRQCVS